MELVLSVTLSILVFVGFFMDAYRLMRYYYYDTQNNKFTRFMDKITNWG
jgi:hypothetical protein